MNHAPLRLILVAVLAVITAIQLIRRHQELQALRTELASLRQQGESLNSETERLRREKSALATRTGEPGQLARLRAENAELRRLQSETAPPVNAKPENAASTSSSSAPPERLADPSPAPSTGFRAKGTAQLRSGDAFLAGGWKMRDDTRAYAIITPILRVDTQGRTKVLVQSQLLFVPDADLGAAGLQNLVSDGPETHAFGVADGPMLQDLLVRITTLRGSRGLIPPRVLHNVPLDEDGEAHDCPYQALPPFDLPAETLRTRLWVRVHPSLAPDGQGLHVGYDLRVYETDDPHP